jgi:TetR/AcrR family transcriptional repressor of nem operon
MQTRTPKPARDLQVRIEEVGIRLFITHGYNGTSYLDIARELGISHSNIHYYYRTKAVLAEAVLPA